MYENGPGADLKSGDGTRNKVVGCIVMYIYPEKWTPSIDGSMVESISWQFAPCRQKGIKPTTHRYRDRYRYR